MNQFRAALRGELHTLRGLLTRHNVNDVDESGWTVLHRASCNNRVDCVILCIELGAHVNVRSNVGYTPLHYALL